MRRVLTPDGEDWLCLNCNEDRNIEAVTEVREDLGLDPRDDICAYAYGIAEAIAGSEQDESRRSTIIAGAAIYLGSILAGDKITQPEISKASKTSESAIRQCYLDIYEQSGFEEAFGPIERGEHNPGTPNDHIRLRHFKAGMRRRKSDKAIKSAVSDVRRFAIWYDGEDPPEPADVEAYLLHIAEEGYAPATIESRYQNLHQYFKWADLEQFDTDQVALEDALAEAWAQKV